MDGKLPIGLMKQATMKLDSFIADIYEVVEENLEHDDKYQMLRITEMAGNIRSAMITMIHKEISYDKFKEVDMAMEEIDSYPTDDYDNDILNIEI